MIINVKKFAPNAVLPIRAHDTDAGFDLTATSVDATPNIITYGTGLGFQIPKGYVGLIFPRSSICKTRLMLSNAVGVIDSGYRGEVKFKFRILSNTDNGFRYEIGDRIGQLIIMPYPEVEYKK